MFLSAAEKFGWLPAPLDALPAFEALPVELPLVALGVEDEPELEPLEALSLEELPLLALGVEDEPELAPLEALSLEELPLLALGVEDDPALAPLEDLSLEELLCAMETLANANSAAAVAVPTIFSI